MFPLLLLVYLQSSPIHPLPSSPYTSYTLEQTCGQDGSKQSLHLNTQAAVFTFNSTNRRKLDCHLELHLHSKALGFSVFIETLKIERSSGCSRDFLQFGRDKFVITTHLSEKYCDTIEHSANITNENGALVGYDFKDTSFPRREYIESNDVEMDIWLELQPAQNNQIKEVKLVVAPFRKSCNEEDGEYYKQCPGTSRCFRRELFSAGIVKCAVKTVEESSSGHFISLPLIIILIVVITIIATLVRFRIEMLLSNSENNNTQTLENLKFRNSTNPTACYPPSNQENPPSYDEVVMMEYMENPPKYSELYQLLE
eukprot:GFUD01010158.1.p1 GENE.GFUD01010158.1~~GFUD01010158.1.p1  ORF type:complete len:312 (-),score=96.17 GFUD01010158.1:151-1086(-)